ncbi:tyrosine-type recombinase/integrase [Haloarcula salina]|uniref:Site-specific integrase n=1 Tax=Haloarcula salina TaxID=1429914 RepID=A0AA41FWP6_9EURY|nr:tyrosine-type recombinase/integrase [Haloarcula salina]MBV0900182.1 site-specific integrase [Haloarcula salina]
MTDADPSEEIQTLRERLESGERGGSDADRDRLLEMSDNMQLIPSEIGDHRQLKILRHCTRMSEEVDDLDLVDVLDDEEAAREVVRWIHREYDNEHTNQDYRTALRSFGRYVLGRDEPPETLAWIPTGTSNDFDPVPSERDLLDYEADVKPMAEACHNTRDAALIMVQFEAGLRAGELYDLEVGDIFDAEHTVGIHPDGKQGEKPTHLKVAVPFLQKWLAEHPAGGDVDAPLWSKISDPERPSYNTFLEYFKRAADRAGVDKPVTPTNFRKSNTRFLIRLGMDLPKIEERQGREQGSEHTARYLARFGDDSLERSYAALHGVDVETDDHDEVAPITCPRCDRDTPRDRDRCMWCGFALSQEATEEARAERKQALEAVSQLSARDDLDTDAVVDTIDRLIDERVDARLDQ